MKKLILAAALLAASSTLSFGAACGAAGAQYLSQLIGGSCTVGTLTFSNFSNFSQTGTLGFNPLGTNQTSRITVTNNGTTGIQFAYVTSDLGSTGFDLTASANQSIAIAFEFDITSAAGPISSYFGQGTFADNKPGSFQFNKDSSTPLGAFIGTATIADGGANYASPTFLQSSAVTVNLSTFHVRDTVNLQGGGGAGTGFATNRNFSNVTQLLPEPMSMGLMGLGLLALGVIGRRVKKS